MGSSKSCIKEEIEEKEPLLLRMLIRERTYKLGEKSLYILHLPKNVKRIIHLEILPVKNLREKVIFKVVKTKGTSPCKTFFANEGFNGYFDVPLESKDDEIKHMELSIEGDYVKQKGLRMKTFVFIYLKNIENLH